MSKADKMFEELGYKKTREGIDCWCIYESNKKKISFEIGFGQSLFLSYKDDDFNDGGVIVSKKELQAINEKCKELRMDLKREWKEIKGYEGKYIISNYGEIISLPRYKQNNSNKENNRVDNLEWCTCKENIQHAYKNNLKTNTQQIKIKQFNHKHEFIQEFESLSKASKILNISIGNISQCINGKRKTSNGFIFERGG